MKNILIYQAVVALFHLFKEAYDEKINNLSEEKDKISYIKNSARIYFPSGKIKKIGKKEPFESDLKHQNSFFKIPKDSQTPFLTLIHPKTKEEISACVEICYETNHFILYRFITEDQTVNLHLIISDTVKIFTDVDNSEVRINVDSLNLNSMIKNKNIDSKFDVQFENIDIIESLFPSEKSKCLLVLNSFANIIRNMNGLNTMYQKVNNFNFFLKDIELMIDSANQNMPKHQAFFL